MKKYSEVPSEDDSSGSSGVIPQATSLSNWYYLGCFFVTIASVLGTGILALPVKTKDSGFWPFFVIFFIVLIMEVCFNRVQFLRLQLSTKEAIVVYTVELMQKAYYLLGIGITDLEKLRTASNPDASFSLANKKNDDENLSSSETIPSNKGKPDMSAPLLHPQAVRRTKPVNLNLHAIGKLFLSRGARWVFDACVYLHFVSILISYVLAASEAWGELIGIHVNCHSKDSATDEARLRYVILVFGFVFTLVIVFGQRLFTSMVSILTSMKGSLLVIMVGVAAFIAADIDQQISSSWRDIADSFLMSTVALGGVVNLMPLVFNKVPQNPNEVKKFRFSIMIGMVVCGLLISLWTYFVMKAVPQYDTDDSGLPSLAEAAENGCISTIPLSQIIELKRPNLTWIAYVITIFIQVSVSVSYITVGSGLKNFLDGYVRHFSKRAQWHHKLPQRLQFVTPKRFYQGLCYFLSYGLSVGFALGKPTCFLVVLEYFTSMGLNLENGAFIAFMIAVAGRYAAFPVPLPLPQPWGSRSAWFIGAFFLFAVVYDIVLFTKHLFGDQDLC